MITAKIAVAIEIAGRVAVTTKANYQPYIYPIRKPKKDIENVMIKVGTFSPMAP